MEGEEEGGAEELVWVLTPLTECSFLHSPPLLDGEGKIKLNVGLIWLQPCSSHRMHINIGRRAVYMQTDKLLLCAHWLKQIKKYHKILPFGCKCLNVEEGNGINEAMFDKGVEKKHSDNILGLSLKYLYRTL